MRGNVQTPNKIKPKSIKKKNIVVIIVAVICLVVICAIIYECVIQKSQTYTVVNGYVEKSSNVQGIVIKQEKVIDINNNNAIIPLVEQGERIRKTESVALYKDNNYQEYISKINDLDKQIETLIKDLPQNYSNDISYIESQIELLGKQARKTTSYIKIQEYKTKIDELTSQKITILGELSPSGSKVRELIDTRKNIEENYKSSANNIKSSMAGCVTYKIDELEGITDTSKVLNYTKNEIDDIFSKYRSNTSSDFGIKIVDNFSEYIIVKVQNNEYIKSGSNIYIKFTDKSNVKESAILTKVVDIDEDNKYCIISMSNGIEKLIDSRCENIEIIWTKKSGMAVPLNAITVDNSNIGKVTTIKNGDYQEVPIKISLSNDNIAIVDNLTDEERKNNGIENKNTLEIYDQLVIKEE
mgnify:FL=1